MESIKKIKEGVTYYARSICDYNCIYQAEIVKRTDKTVWIKDPKFPHDKIKSRRIIVIDGVEGFYPDGRYSMAAYMDAYKIYDPKTVY